MPTKRTDLADEAGELFARGAEKTTALPGVRARRYERRRCAVTAVQVLDARGSRAIGKPAGKYLTVALRSESPADPCFSEEALCIAEELRRLLPPRGGSAPVLVAGLGNRAVTADNVGPAVVENLLITRHLEGSLPADFPPLAPVCAVAPGVLAATGVESAEVVRGVAARVRPACVIVVDALVARRLERVCRTVQLSDTGLVPGSGVGNHRAALNEDTLHVPVLAVGVPTVIEAATLAADLLESGRAAAPEAWAAGENAVVTPKDIDGQIRRLGRLVGLGINLALQPALDAEDLAALLG